jgi:hypothetical protein
MGEDRLRWRQLENLLDGYLDWHLEHDLSGPMLRFGKEGPMWRFGKEGVSRIILGIDDGEFVLHSADTDDDYRFSSISGVRDWLELHEAEHAGYSELQKQLAGYFLAEEVEKWLREPPEET